MTSARGDGRRKRQGAGGPGKGKKISPTDTARPGLLIETRPLAAFFHWLTWPVSLPDLTR